MATIWVDASRAPEIRQMYGDWVRKQPDPPSIVAYPPEGGPGPDNRVSFNLVPPEFIEHLRSAGQQFALE